MNRYFRASLHKSIPVASVLVIAFFLALSVVHFRRSSYYQAAFDLAIPVVLCLLAVRGYSIADGKLWIHRLGWRHGVSLSELSRVEADPGLLKGAISLWAIRGIFGTDGYCYSKRLGWFRAYIRDSHNPVLLEFRDARRIVVTPESPTGFAEAVQAAMTR